MAALFGERCCCAVLTLFSKEIIIMRANQIKKLCFATVLRAVLPGTMKQIGILEKIVSEVPHADRTV